MQSDSGITIAFIAKDSQHPTSINYNLVQNTGTMISIRVLSAEQDKNKKEIYNILKGERDEQILSDKINMI